MDNPVITNIDQGSVPLDAPKYQADTFTAAGAGTILAGTILARDSVSLKLVVFAKGGATNENGIPKAITDVDIVATGAGDLPVRPIIAGGYRREKLIIDADGDDSNVDEAVVDQLRDFSLVGRPVTENLVLDNQ